LPDVGVKDEIVGEVFMYVNPERVPVPAEFVTETLPEFPFPTIAVILVGLTTVNDVATKPPKLTEVIPVKLLPVIVTVFPLVAEAGEKLDTTDADNAVPAKSELSHKPLPYVAAINFLSL